MNLKYLIIQSIACAIIFISCESHEQKADEAFKNYKAERVLEIDSSTIFKDSIHALLKLKNEKKIIKAEAYDKFKNDVYAQVKRNNLVIIHLKEQYLSSSKVFRKIERLEKINNKFIKQLKDFELENKNNRKDFEQNINKELNDFNLSMKEYEY